MDRKDLGKLGEDLACGKLVKKGYKILEKNYRINLGEIDIIAKYKGVIHFIEVKTLSGPRGYPSGVFSPEQRANWKKQRKIMKLAEMWLLKNKIPENTSYQIDIVAVSIDEITNEPKIDFFENVVEDKY